METSYRAHTPATDRAVFILLKETTTIVGKRLLGCPDLQPTCIRKTNIVDVLT